MHSLFLTLRTRQRLTHIKHKYLLTPLLLFLHITIWDFFVWLLKLIIVIEIQIEIVKGK